MTKKKKQRYLHSWAVAHALAFEVPPEKPPRDAPPEVKAKARRGLHAFHMAIARGTAPRPDMKRGIANLWDEERFDDWKRQKEAEQKKAAERANAQQPDLQTPPQSEDRAQAMPQRVEKIKRAEAVGHG